MNVPSALRLVVLAFALLGAAACGPTVGDACETSAACGTGLVCDLATPGGYCTRTPCRAGECPDESVCVDFGAEASWCMRRCDGGEGCRDGLSCVSPETAECLDDVSGCKFCAVP